MNMTAQIMMKCGEFHSLAHVFFCKIREAHCGEKCGPALKFACPCTCNQMTDMLAGKMRAEKARWAKTTHGNSLWTLAEVVEQLDMRGVRSVRTGTF